MTRAGRWPPFWTVPLAVVLLAAADGEPPPSAAAPDHAPWAVPGVVALSAQPVPARDALADAIVAAAEETWMRAAPDVAAGLFALYGASPPARLWLDATGAPTGDARTGVALLTGATAEGLEPAAYGAAEVAARLGALAGRGAGRQAAARFEVALSAALLQLLRDLDRGLVDPRAVEFWLPPRARQPDLPALLRESVAAHRLPEAVAELSRLPGLHVDLRAALARYRAVAADPAVAPLPATGPALVSGKRSADLAALHRLLAAFGDLAPEVAAPGPTAVFGAEHAAAVARFQARHGLAADGVVGPATRRALAVPLAFRVRQLELALERLRWLPDLGEERLLLVNLATYRLSAYGADARREKPELEMAVVVGKALRTETPVLVAALEQVVFRPSWGVPVSIAAGEVVPAQVRDPTYLDRHGMELVGRGGAVPATPANLELARRGALSIRQRPGPGNALGLVNLHFPNPYGVYMHGTPETALFRRARRDESHGCVRVEDPVALTTWALAGEAGWAREQVAAAMRGSRSRTVSLATPVRVVFYYLTAVATDGGRSVHFAEDVYGLDARLESALSGADR
jgi:murein L,D-transpeptidase YcbB/YkuD